MKLSEQEHYYDEEDGCMIVGGVQYDALVLFDEVIRLEAYSDKLADGLPLLPKDIEILQKANADFAEANAQLEEENEALKRENAIMRDELLAFFTEGYIDGVLADTQEQDDAGM